MLLSPGHSPRQISSPSPSISDKQIVNPSNFKSSTKNPRKRSAVLDEDSYVSAIEKIIERDFFPDIPKLRDRLDWLEAVRSADPVQIRDTQLKILERRGGKFLNFDTYGKIQTPGSTFFRNSSTTPFEFDKTPVISNDNDESLVFGESSEDLCDVPFSLDEFFRRYTSEDNDSFSKLLEKVNRRRKKRYRYLFEGEEEDVKLIQNLERDGRITDGYGTSNQPPSTLEGWKYTARNLLMYHPSDNGEAPLTEEEKEERLKGLTKEINRPNTRFGRKLSDSGPKDEDTVAVLYTPVVGGTPVPKRYSDKIKKYDLEDLKKTPNPFCIESNKKADNGYNYVKTPSPAPGADGSSPFITWGEIEGTPLRLESEDTPLDIGGSGSGSQFKIPLPPIRDVVAHSLSREAARKIRERSKMLEKPPLPSPVRGGSASPGARRLSPAAQKFVRNAIGKSPYSVDESLRASYRGSSPGRSMSRLGRDNSIGSWSPSVRDGSNPPW